MLTVLGGLAEFARELIRARTSEGRQRAQERGCQVASWNENIEQRFDLGSNSENLGQRNSHYWCLRLK